MDLVQIRGCRGTKSVYGALASNIQNVQDMQNASAYMTKANTYILSHIVSMHSVLPCIILFESWWHHQMETFSASLALCAGNSPVAREFPSQRPVTRSFDVLFDLYLNKRLTVNNREAGDLRRYRTHYDVTVMFCHNSLWNHMIYFSYF